MVAFLLDMDGVLYRGGTAIPSAIPFLAALAPHRVLFLTNNSSIAPEAVSAKLEKLGFGAVDPNTVLTSALATASWIAGQKPAGFSYFAVGGPGLHAALKGAGGREDAENPDFVAVGEGDGLSYDALTVGINAIRRGAILVGTNPDTTLDAGDGRLLPGGGALVAPFAVGGGVEPVIIGKPAPWLYTEALKRLGVGPENVVMIGDRPDTDIAGAVACGIGTILVRTGRFAPGEPYPDDLPRPDFDINDLAELDLAKLVAWLEARTNSRN